MFNPKTYDISKRQPYLTAWLEAERALEDCEVITSTIGAANDARKHLHVFNRVRVAYREQEADGFRFDHIKASVYRDVPDATWGIKFELQAITNIEFTFNV